MREYLDHVQLSLEEANEIKGVLDQLLKDIDRLPIGKDLYYDMLKACETLVEKGATP